MNRTSLSVIALAVGAVLIIGLYNVYKPQTKGLVDKVFHKVNIENLSHPTTHKYDGLTYTDDGNGNVEFTKGKEPNHPTYTWNNGFVKHAPKDVQRATSIKFDNADVSNANLIGMLDYDPYVKSIDFGDHFDSSRSNLASMFDHDPQLRSVHFGKEFKPYPGQDLTVSNMLSSDPKLKLSGDIPSDVQTAYNNNHNSMFDMNHVIDGKPLKDFL